MTVHLPARIERIVNDAVHSGEYRSAEDVLSEAIAVWQAEKAGGVFPTQIDAVEAAREARYGSPQPVERVQDTEQERQAAIERLKAFGKAHRLSLGGMTIKQLRDEARP
jgi:Arc/MetJ-type ribon-helix-helix transcriptional regulator